MAAAPSNMPSQSLSQSTQSSVMERLTREASKLESEQTHAKQELAHLMLEIEQMTSEKQHHVQNLTTLNQELGLLSSEADGFRKLIARCKKATASINTGQLQERTQHGATILGTFEHVLAPTATWMLNGLCLDGDGNLRSTDARITAFHMEMQRVQSQLSASVTAVAAEQQALETACAELSAELAVATQDMQTTATLLSTAEEALERKSMEAEKVAHEAQARSAARNDALLQFVRAQEDAEATASRCKAQEEAALAEKETAAQQLRAVQTSTSEVSVSLSQVEQQLGASVATYTSLVQEHAASLEHMRVLESEQQAAVEAAAALRLSLQSLETDIASVPSMTAELAELQLQLSVLRTPAAEADTVRGKAAAELAQAKRDMCTQQLRAQLLQATPKLFDDHHCAVKQACSAFASAIATEAVADQMRQVLAQCRKQRDDDADTPVQRYTATVLEGIQGYFEAVQTVGKLCSQIGGVSGNVTVVDMRRLASAVSDLIKHKQQSSVSIQALQEDIQTSLEFDKGDLHKSGLQLKKLRQEIEATEGELSTVLTSPALKRRLEADAAVDAACARIRTDLETALTEFEAGFRLKAARVKEQAAAKKAKLRKEISKLEAELTEAQAVAAAAPPHLAADRRTPAPSTTSKSPAAHSTNMFTPKLPFQARTNEVVDVWDAASGDGSPASLPDARFAARPPAKAVPRASPQQHDFGGADAAQHVDTGTVLDSPTIMLNARGSRAKSGADQPAKRSKGEARADVGSAVSQRDSVSPSASEVTEPDPDLLAAIHGGTMLLEGSMRGQRTGSAPQAAVDATAGRGRAGAAPQPFRRSGSTPATASRPSGASRGTIPPTSPSGAGMTVTALMRYPPVPAAQARVTGTKRKAPDQRGTGHTGMRTATYTAGNKAGTVATSSRVGATWGASTGHRGDGDAASVAGSVSALFDDDLFTS